MAVESKFTGETSSGSEAPIEVAPGVYRFGTKRVNWYVIEENGQLTVVDAGLPDHWGRLEDGLAALGYSLNDIEALVLTHGHADHIGFAERLRTETGIPIFVHAADRSLVTGSSPPPRGLLLNLWRPAVARYFLEVLRSGVRDLSPVRGVETIADGDELDVSGHPRVLHLPGHSAGECVLWLADRETLFVGDAMVTLDLATGRPSNPRLPRSWLNADHETARTSLSTLESLGAAVVLSGHGDPWTGDLAEAVHLARGT